MRFSGRRDPYWLESRRPGVLNKGYGPETHYEQRAGLPLCGLATEQATLVARLGVAKQATLVGCARVAGKTALIYRIGSAGKTTCIEGIWFAFEASSIPSIRSSLQPALLRSARQLVLRTMWYRSSVCSLIGILGRVRVRHG